MEVKAGAVALQGDLSSAGPLSPQASCRGTREALGTVVVGQSVQPRDEGCHGLGQEGAGGGGRVWHPAWAQGNPERAQTRCLGRPWPSQAQLHATLHTPHCRLSPRPQCAAASSSCERCGPGTGTAAGTSGHCVHGVTRASAAGVRLCVHTHEGVGECAQA